MLKHLYILFSAVLFFSCKKNNDSSTADPGEDDCVQRASANNGDNITSQYIVSFSPVINSRTASRVTLNDVSKNILTRYKINVSALKESVGGEPGGFVAKMSSEDAEILRHDGSVGAVEQDRIISLGNCFTVVEPRLITWNINRVGYGNGTGKTAWIIDSGIDYDHRDLTVDQGRSRSFIEGETSASDSNGHGTHVAGIIGAINNR